MPEPKNCTSLAEVRSEIDRLDRSLIAIISRRQEYVHEAARFKRDEEHVHARERQRSMLVTRRQWAETEGVNPDLIESLFRTMVDHFVNAELATFSERTSLEKGGQSSSILDEAGANAHCKSASP